MEESNKYSVQNTCNKLSQRLIDYIKTEYFRNNDELRKVCSKFLKEPGVVFQSPYVEANAAYTISESGISSSNIPDDIKSFLECMSEENLGVFKNPYTHQIQALEGFCEGKDVFVATGTGSGKTECFMWPIASKLFNEAKNQDSWKNPGIRVLMLYPMNALVSDQVGRLRRMLGTDMFRNLFREKTRQQRIPTFGMYTSRTPYSGPQTASDDKQIANTLKENIIELPDELQNKLRQMGRYPSKHDLNGFIKSLDEGTPYDSSDDSEYITRQEMQLDCPDILITNYSMLEFMLLRHVEDSIWNSTRAWLSSDQSNKLLFIIDEAHMYRGSAGGEISLLIKRVLNRLGISRDRVQFILTSASIPKNSESEVRLFANRISTQENGIDRFILIQGDKQKIPPGNKIVDALSLKLFDIDSLNNENTVFTGIHEFCKCTGLEDSDCDYSDMKTVSNWLYNNLPDLEPVSRTLSICREHAQKYEDLASMVFPDTDNETSRHAMDSILGILPLAKNELNQPLFPTKLHMFIRGLPGIFACVNPRCTFKNHDIPGLGKITIDSQKKYCDCGGRIFELMNHRPCGSLFIKGYVEDKEGSDDFIWDKKGLMYDKDLKEIHLFIVPEGEIPELDSNVIDCWLDSKTGMLSYNDNHSEEDGYAHVLYYANTTPGHFDIKTFVLCPFCHKKSVITDLRTKGNHPFFNVVSQQLKIQPPSLFSEEDIKQTPNRGRKVLLFSDSRKNAANLAKDLSDLSLEDSMRGIIVLSASKISEWSSHNENRSTNLKFIYPTILKIIQDADLKIFYGDLKEQIEEDIRKNKEELQRGFGTLFFNLLNPSIA